MAASVVEYPASMLETGLFKTFSHIDFNQMRNLEDKSGKTAKPDPKQMDKAIDTLSKVLVKYEMHDLLGITLVHNHFQLNNGEIVTTSVDPNNQLEIRSCWNNEVDRKQDSPVFYLQAATDGENSKIPYMWALDAQANAFFCMQYFDGKYQKMHDRFEKLAQRTNLAPFLEEYIDALKSLGMTAHLGLFLIYQDLVPMDLDKDILYEITDKETRQQVLFITTKKQVKELMAKHGNESMVYTNWTVYHDALTGSMWCCVGSCCTSH